MEVRSGRRERTDGAGRAEVGKLGEKRVGEGEGGGDEGARAEEEGAEVVAHRHGGVEEHAVVACGARGQSMHAVHSCTNE